MNRHNPLFAIIVLVLATARDVGGSAEAVSAAEVLWRANGRRGLRAAEQRHSPGGGTAESYKQTRCPGDCSGRGNCNGELGTCDCLTGYGGAACQEDLLAACRWGGDFETMCIPPSPSRALPLTCACAEACVKIYGPRFGRPASCLNGLPPWGDQPPTDADISSFILDPALHKAFSGVPSDEHEISLSSLRDSANCSLYFKTGCNGHGVCWAGGADEGENTCRCASGWGEVHCDEEKKVPCPSDCLGIGECIQGRCLCKPGFWGDDCSLSLGKHNDTRLWGLSPSQRGPPLRPSIYVYHLPPRFGSDYAHVEMDRPLAESLHEWLLGSPHRTADPAEADYFFLPVSVRQLRTERTAEVLQYVVRAFPFFNRSRGADHLLVVTDDSGLADTLPFMGEARRREVELNDTESLWHGLIQVTYSGDMTPPANFRRGRDIVMPPAQSFSTGFDPDWSGLLWEARDPSVKLSADAPKRTNVLFWRGTVRRSGKPHNVRLKVLEAHAGKPGFVIEDISAAPRGNPRDYALSFSSSTFCLAPPGMSNGWGRRATLAALYGCIPVIIQDDLVNPLEEILDWSSFSVTVPEGDIDRLDTILTSIPPQRVLEMQGELRCAWPFFLYSQVYGAYAREPSGTDAFSGLMHVLWQRLYAQKHQNRTAALPPCELVRQMKEKGCLGKPLVPYNWKGLRRVPPRPWPSGSAVCHSEEEVAHEGGDSHDGRGGAASGAGDGVGDYDMESTKRKAHAGGDFHRIMRHRPCLSETLATCATFLPEKKSPHRRQ